MTTPKVIIGKLAVIDPENDNELYDPYRGKTLRITHASREGMGYDKTLYPELLCSFECNDGTNFPFSLYEFEFNILP